MKILFMYGHSWGGAFVISQALELNRMGHAVTIICTGPGPFSDACAKLSIPTIFNSFDGSRLRDVPRILRSLVTLVRQIRKLRPDVLHYHLIKATVVGRICGAIAGVPLRFSQLGGPLTLELWKFRWLDLMTSFLDTRIICPSIGVMKIYGRYAITRNKTTILYYAFDNNAFVAAVETSRLGARLELGISQSDMVLIMVAHMYGSDHRRFRNVSVKGHETLIAAAALVLKQHPNAKFLVVGEDPDGTRINFNRLNQMVLDEGLDGHFIFTGNRNDVPRLIASADVAVVPSLSENCGGAVEPFAAGLPVVASDTGGLAELVLPGVTGFRFAPGDVHELGHALIEALNLTSDDRQKLGRNGQKLVQALFDPVMCAEAQASIYQGDTIGQLGEYENCKSQLGSM